MTGLRWLRLNKTGLENIPPEIYKLKKLVTKTWLFYFQDEAKSVSLYNTVKFRQILSVHDKLL